MNESAADPTDSPSDRLEQFREHAWGYFSMHAEQRLRTFHFFIILETTLTAAGFVAAKDEKIPAVLVLSGLLMLLFALVFWKLDKRTRGMIKVAEESLCLYEMFAVANLPSEFKKACPFLNDPQRLRAFNFFPLVPAVLTYSKCFGIVFFAFGAVGLGLTAWAGKYFF
jgi:hypothetical protein